MSFEFAPRGLEARVSCALERHVSTWRRPLQKVTRAIQLRGTSKMRRWVKIACLIVLACAPGAVFASSAFAWTGSTYAPYQYPVVPPKVPAKDASLMAGSSIKAQDGWENVYLTGDAYQRGFQDGYLTAQSADYFIEMCSDVNPAGGFTFASGKDGVGPVTKSPAVIANECIAGYTIWPLIPAEYQQELEGIADGMSAWYAAQGLTCPDNLWDVVCLNAATGGEYGEGAYTYTGPNTTPPPIPASPTHGREYLPKVSTSVATAVRSALKHPAARPKAPRCSAFIASGKDWTTDGEPVMAHDSWYSWSLNFEFNIMCYVHPTDPSGHPIGYDYAYQTCGGYLASGQDFYENGAGLLLSETSVSDSAFNPNGVPLFVRCAETMEYCSTCDEAAFGRTVHNHYTDLPQTCPYPTTMGLQAGTGASNGAYCNEWLIGDSTGRIASLILGTLAYDYHTTKDGMYGSCNYNWGPNVLYEDSQGVPTPNGSGAGTPGKPTARWNRWLQVEAQYQGKGAIDAAVGIKFQSDKFDTSAGLANHPDGNTLTGEESIPYAPVAARYGIATALTGIPPATVRPGTDNPSATTTNYYPAYAGVTAAKTSDSGDLDGKVTTEAMARHGLQVWAHWGYATGDNFFAEPYPQNETDYFAAHPITATVAAASVPGASEVGSTVTITTTKANAVMAGQNVTIAGVSVAGYNGTFPVTAVLSTTQFTYTDPISGLAASSGGSVSQAENPATTQKAWEIAAMIGVVNTGPNGNAVPWTYLGEAVSVSGVPSGWSTKPVTLTFNTEGSWKSIMYKLDRGGWRSGSTLTIPAPTNGRNDGVHRVRYYAVSGRSRSPLQSCTVKIDTQGPRTVATNVPKKAVSGPLTLNLQAGDWASGVATDWYVVGTFIDGTDGILPLYQWGPTTWYSLDGAPYVEGTTVTVTGAGRHTLSFYSTDNAGNKESANTITVKIG